MKREEISSYLTVDRVVLVISVCKTLNFIDDMGTIRDLRNITVTF